MTIERREDQAIESQKKESIMRELFGRVIVLSCAVLSSLVLGQTPSSEKPLTNADVVALAKAGLGDGIVVQKIQQAPTEALDVSTDVLIRAQKQGLSKAVIEAMLKRVALRTPPTPTPTETPVPVPTATLGAKSKDKEGEKKGDGARRPCEANFTVEGSFWKGKTYRSFQEFPGMTDKAKAIERLAQSLASAGWQSVTPNKDSGVISAAQTVSGGEGAQTPLNVIVKDLPPAGLRVEIVYQTHTGNLASEKSVKQEFCKTLEATQPQ